MTRAEQLTAALQEVRERIAEACVRAGRSAHDVRLVAVSKKMPPEDVQAALAAGQLDFGESYAQELRDKRAALETAAPIPGNRRPRWHFLGPIQSNKVKYLAGQVELIQSLDDPSILAEIDRRMGGSVHTGGGVHESVGVGGIANVGKGAGAGAGAQAAGAGASGAAGEAAPGGASGRQACLVQVNVARETSKGGVPPHRLGELLDRFATSLHAVCVGLMLIPPISDDQGVTRRHFAALRNLAERERAVRRPHVTLTELSMGMSGDFADAVAEGATMVRVGTAIFGARPPR